MEHLTDRVLFGAAYYHEYHASPRLEEDLRLMVEAGFSVIRVGESVWSTWEPADGQFNLDWLQPILDGAHKNGIKVIIGTPTYAAPMWLARQNPEINTERRSGQPMGWGHRQEINYAAPAFLFYAERIIRAIVGRYAEHPAVIGFQVDNEPGNEIFHNRQVFEKFRNWLREQYGTVEKLNEEWGLTYWSHRLSAWDDLWTPDANVQPQYTLAWRRFQAEITTDFIGWQADLVRQYSRADQFVTTCISYERPTVEDEKLTRRLDVTAGNPYYRMQDELTLPYTKASTQHWTTTGTWALFATADRMYGSKQAPFLVTETDAQAIGMTWSNEPAWDGQWRQAAWALVSRGATMIEYWHWHTLHAGAETYWGGVLPHSLEPGRVYQQIAELGAEFAAAGDRVTELTPHSDVALLYSNDSKWALSEYPAIGTLLKGDARSFQTIYDSFARGTFEAGLQSNTVHAAQITAQSPEGFAAAHPVLVAAAFTIADEAQLRWLEAYAAAGGHLVVGIRTGYEDEEARARHERKPAFLDAAAGVCYDEFSNLETPLALSGADWLPVDAAGTLWADGLQLGGGGDGHAGEGHSGDGHAAEVLATYEHPHFARFPAITTRVHGAGRVTYVGTVPNQPLASALMAWAVEVGSGTPSWQPQSVQQTVSTSTNRHGERVQVVHNWNWEPSEFVVPAASTDVLSGEELASGAVLKLGAWDVRVLTTTE